VTRGMAIVEKERREAVDVPACGKGREDMWRMLRRFSADTGREGKGRGLGREERQGCTFVRLEH
jgi:hypothetical protein